MRSETKEKNRKKKSQNVLLGTRYHGDDAQQLGGGEHGGEGENRREGKGG